MIRGLWIVKIVFTTCLIVDFLTAFGANDPDKIHVQFNKPFYVTGETVFFKIYLLNREEVESKIVHVNLIDSAGNLVMHQILRIENNAANGAYKIPYDLKEGNYLFRCYTRWNMNFGSNSIFSNIIPIFNEFEGGVQWDAALLSKTDSIKSTYPIAPWAGIRLRLTNPRPVHTNDSVSVEISWQDQTVSRETGGSLSVSVVNASLAGYDGERPNVESTVTLSGKHSITYLPEDSIHVAGIATDPATGHLLTSRVCTIYDVQTGTFTRLRCVQGKFSFDIPVFEGKSDFQILNLNSYQARDPEIQLASQDKELPAERPFDRLPVRTPEVLRYLYFSSLRRKIGELFYVSGMDSISAGPVYGSPPTHFKPDKSYDMEKYHLVRDVVDFMREGVINTAFFRESGMEKFRLYNVQTKRFFMTTPWFIVDGHFIFNDSLVYHIPFAHLQRIDLYESTSSIYRYFEPIMVQGGVVAIFTKDNYMANYIKGMTNTLEISGVPPKIQINQERTPNSSDPRASPDLAPMIYWEPQLNMGADGTTLIKFGANDTTGDYLVHVEGINGNGELLSGNLIISVASGP